MKAGNVGHTLEPAVILNTVGTEVIISPSPRRTNASDSFECSETKYSLIPSTPIATKHYWSVFQEVTAS